MTRLQLALMVLLLALVGVSQNKTDCNNSDDQIECILRRGQ